MRTAQKEIEERTRLAGSNKFELLLFRLGESPGSGQRELFGINVFKVREVLVMPPVTELANAHEHLMGVANIRGQIIPVINLPAVLGCVPKKGLSILMVTEFGRTVQAFAVEDVREIVQLDWDQVLPAESSHAGALITGIARLDGATADTRLAQVLDVEQILKTVMPVTTEEINREVVGPELVLPAGSTILVADDSAVARSVIELGLKAMGVTYIMTKTGKEAWERLQAIAEEATANGKTAREKVAVVLTDLEMPEMDGFTLTRLIKQDPRFKSIPVVIHSSLTGTTNENHVKSVGADAYVAKFAPRELAATIRNVLPPH
ncbi:chemotaxis protein [Rhodoferax sp.]|uniref:chemotaxis protein n=1 Tax=Rhodoferax sp. TaxID=50421 RepID=UPI001EB5ABA8|nr:chemotaxis protein [Rhodoferax sp.]MBT9507519.1 chemotaxis protein CheV [Rhodoferax sp.]